VATNTLTDAKCRAAKSGDKPVKLFDGLGLFLYVSTTGAKTWRLAVRVDGKPQTLTFGPYPEVTLANARELRDDARAKLRAGTDPRQKPKDKTVTLAQASAEYWSGRKDLSPSYIENATRAIAMHIAPRLGARPVGDISRDDLLGVLLAMDAKGLHSYVRKTRMWVGQVFDWAIERGHATGNPAMLIKPDKAFSRARVEHFAALEPKEMPEFMQRLAAEGRIQSALALRLLALTWVRTNELRMMRWDEIDGDTWVIPAGKMKRRLDHVVPLSTKALDLLAELKTRAGDSPYVMPAEHRADRPISENAVLFLIHRMGYKGRMTGHGLRSVASTWANERGYPPDVIERQLAHVPADAVRRAYNRAAYMDQRRAMLQDWAEWLG
jgi:integrase